MLRVCYTELPEDLRLEEMQIPLSAYRADKLRRTSLPQVRRQMLAAELLLNRAVRALHPDAPLPLDVQKGEGEKPFFPSLPLFFSLSHSGPFVACAVADREIGLDLQMRSALHEPLVRRFFSDEERRYVQESTDRDAAFTEVWCLKESYLKAIGAGLRQPLSEVSLKFGEEITLADSNAVRFWRFQDPRFHMAVCTLDGSEPTPDRLEKAELRP